MVSVLNQNEFLVVRRAGCGAEVPSQTAGQLPTGKDSPALGLGQASAEASQADPLSLPLPPHQGQDVPMLKLQPPPGRAALAFI